MLIELVDRHYGCRRFYDPSTGYLYSVVILSDDEASIMAQRGYTDYIRMKSPKEFELFSNLELEDYINKYVPELLI